MTPFFLKLFLKPSLNWVYKFTITMLWMHDSSWAYISSALDAWTQAGYISAATSLLCSANGIYRIIFYKCYLKINMIDVPFVPLFAETQGQDKDQDQDKD